VGAQTEICTGSCTTGTLGAGLRARKVEYRCEPRDEMDPADGWKMAEPLYGATVGWVAR